MPVVPHRMAAARGALAIMPVVGHIIPARIAGRIRNTPGFAQMETWPSG
jgi:hypothetical protein